MEKNVLEWLEAKALEHADKTVYEDMTESLSFGDLIDEAKSIGSALASKELSGKPVAVMMKRSVHTISAYLGVVYSGRAYAPIDITQPASRIARQLATLDPDAVISDDDAQTDVSPAKLMTFSSLVSCKKDEAELQRIRSRMTDDEPLYIIFTSGSSGRPKGVVTSHHSLMCYIRAYADMMEISEDDRFCAQAPLDYIAAIRDIYLPLLRGAYTFICPKEYFMQPGVLFDIMNEKQITCVGWSTSALCVLSKLNALKEEPPAYLKKICFSGSVMPSSVLRGWQESLKEARFVNQYGPTEVTASCTYHKLDHVAEEDEKIPVGIPYEGYRVFLLGDDDKEVMTGGLGEICIAGPAVALGYYNDPVQTEKAFVQNPLNPSYREIIYRTGDIGRFREDGILEFHGRRDRQIKHMGHRVELDEIESAAVALDGVEEAAALYDSDKETLWLFYIGASEEREVIRGLREKIPGFMVPRKVKKAEDLPRLANGKTDMVRLNAMMKEGA